MASETKLKKKKEGKKGGGKERKSNCAASASQPSICPACPQQDHSTGERCARKRTWGCPVLGLVEMLVLLILASSSLSPSLVHSWGMLHCTSSTTEACLDAREQTMPPNACPAVGRKSWLPFGAGRCPVGTRGSPLGRIQPFGKSRRGNGEVVWLPALPLPPLPTISTSQVELVQSSQTK